MVEALQFFLDMMLKVINFIFGLNVFYIRNIGVSLGVFFLFFGLIGFIIFIIFHMVLKGGKE